MDGHGANSVISVLAEMSTPASTACVATTTIPGVVLQGVAEIEPFSLLRSSSRKRECTSTLSASSETRPLLLISRYTSWARSTVLTIARVSVPGTCFSAINPAISRAYLAPLVMVTSETIFRALCRFPKPGVCQVVLVEL